MARSFQDLSWSSVCLAHSYNARVVFTTSIPDKLLLTNATFEQQIEWITDQVDRVEALGGDGINVDYEDDVPSNDTTKQRQLTFITQLLQIELKKRNPYSSLVWDFGWKPNVDDRYYDYGGLGGICDYVFLMVYDTQSQIETGPPCLAGPNSPISAVQKSLDWYSSSSSSSSLFDLHIPYEKLILGLPWYGYYYNCTSYDPTTEECTIPAIPFRGVECSDAAGRQLDYPFTMAALRESKTQPIFDRETLSMKAVVTTTTTTTTPSTEAPKTTSRRSRRRTTEDTASVLLTTDNTTVAYYFDSPDSVKAKVEIAWNVTQGRLGGVGMWNADVPNYTNSQQGHAFWNSMILPTSNLPP
jgi:Glycosyl hydrolases family 18